MSAEQFFDTNVILYVLSGDRAKADRAEALLTEGGTISVQVLPSTKGYWVHSRVGDAAADRHPHFPLVSPLVPQAAIACARSHVVALK